MQNNRNTRLLAPPMTIVTTASLFPSSSNRASTDILQVPTTEQYLNESGSQSLAPSDSTFLSLRVPASPTASLLDGETLRSRASSFISNAGTTRSRAYSDVNTIRSRYEGDELTSEEALRPDKTTEQDFEVPNNPFAFSPGQLNKLLNPKSLAAYKVLGGIRGLERGLRTDVVAGLSRDETSVQTPITFEEATRNEEAKFLSNTHLIREDDLASDRNLQGQFVDRKRVFKDNRLPAKNTVSIWALFWNAFNDRILLILTAAAVISLALGIYEAVGQTPAPGQAQSVDWVEGLAILVAVVLVVLVTGLNDYRREKQFVILNEKKEDRQVKVVRSGKSLLISVFDIIVGDVLHIEAGDSSPADGVLISGYGLQCDESSATGESEAMKKSTGDEVWRRIEHGTASSKLDPFIISGSKVLEGVGTYLVTSVGINSSHGKIMMSLQTKNEDTPLQVKLAKMANWIGYLGSAAAGLLFFILLVRFLIGLSGNTASPAMKGSQFLDILIVAITIIVVAVPEGLPVAVTLALSFATSRMLKENNLVRQLRACETMGNATTICSDKTGTLTQNKMTVVAGVLGSGMKFARHAVSNNSDVESFATIFGQLSSPVKNILIESIAINSTAFEGEENGNHTFIGSKTETALLVLAKEQLGMGPVAEERAGVEVVQIFPFDSDRKCMGIVTRTSSGSYRLLVKGAAEIMLAKATKKLVERQGEVLQVAKFTDSARTRASATITEYAEQSLRTIALLYRDFQEWPPARVTMLEDDKYMVKFEDIFEEMTFLGVFAIQDPVREGVPGAVKKCQDAGIVVRMVTGDNLTTASAIATQCGIKTASGLVMEGPEFRQLSSVEMDTILPNLQVLARSSPNDKQLLVSRLKHLGETVAVTGDGTNDAPALKTADIGFSMGIAGTEVAKEASSIILMDDNFASIVNAIMWGRSVNDSVSKFLQFQITVNITAVVLAFVSAVSSPTSHSVLSAVQLLWVNLIMDTFAALALATDAPTEKILDRKPVPKSAPLITTNMWKMIIGQAIYQLVVTFTLYFAGATILGYDVVAHPELQTELDTMVFNTFVWMQIFNEFNNRRLDNKLNIFEGVHRNFFFLGINIIMVAGQVLIVFVGGTAFQITSIDGVQWAICLLCAVPCLVWAVVLRCVPDQWAKAIFGMVGMASMAVWRPMTKVLIVVWTPAASACTALRRGFLRLVKRGKAQAHTLADEEIGVAVQVPAADRGTSAEESCPPVEMTRNIPPITFTEMD
ncbi:plasma membrane calcium [Ptychographa xylographoides]|nr:plasma membrane calcium [Ptychographa xylographoides]